MFGMFKRANLAILSYAWIVNIMSKLSALAMHHRRAPATLAQDRLI
jgi:hypothetical protein